MKLCLVVQPDSANGGHMMQCNGLTVIDWRWRSLLVGMMLLALVACRAPTPDTSAQNRTVLVMQVGAASGVSGAVFAGDVRAREESPLAFRVGGKISKRHVDAGSRVQQGQVLAELDAADAGLQVAAAQAEVDRLQGDLQRYRALLAQKLISQSAFDAQQSAHRAARAQLDVLQNQRAYTQLRAPQHGVIASRLAEAGQVVAAGQAMFTLAADSGREIAISLPESRIRDFHTGQAASVELWAVPDVRLAGVIREIAAAADPQTRTYAARVALDHDSAKQVELGQSARVMIAENAQIGIRLPLSALQRNAQNEASVWVVDAQHQIQLRRVDVGAYSEETVPVRAGLKAGEWVVAAGGHLLQEAEIIKPVDRNNRPVNVQVP